MFDNQKTKFVHHGLGGVWRQLSLHHAHQCGKMGYPTGLQDEILHRIKFRDLALVKFMEINISAG